MLEAAGVEGNWKMGKLLRAVAAFLGAVVLTGCFSGGAGKSADALEQWVESQESFPGVEYRRESSMFGTTGATAIYRASDIDDAKRFAEAVVEETARIGAKAGVIAAELQWPVSGGTVSMRFSGDASVSEEWWRVADAPLPEAAIRRNVGWRKQNVQQSGADDSIAGLDVVEYESPKALVTALGVSEDDSWQVTVGTAPDDVLGPFRASEMAQRAENLQRLADRGVGYELAGDRVVLQQAEHLFDGAETLGEHGWKIEQGKFKIRVGPADDPHLDLLRWMIDSGGDYGFEQRSGMPSLFATNRDACIQMLDEAPLPSGPIRVGCSNVGFATTEIDSEEARTAMPILLDAVKAGTERVTLQPDMFHIELDPDDKSAWESSLRGIRRLDWEGERKFRVRGATAYAVPFRSTADGEAIDPEFPEDSTRDKPFLKDAEAVVEAWNSSK